MLEDAEVLVDSDNLSQLKAEYNITGSARTAISANRRAARKQDLVARYPFLQVRALRAVRIVCLSASHEITETASASMSTDRDTHLRRSPGRRVQQ